MQTVLCAAYCTRRHIQAIPELYILQTLLGHGIRAIAPIPKIVLLYFVKQAIPAKILRQLLKAKDVHRNIVHVLPQLH